MFIYPPLSVSFADDIVRRKTCLEGGKKFDLIVAPSNVKGGGNGLFIQTFGRAVDGGRKDCWKICAYEGVNVSKDVNSENFDERNLRKTDYLFGVKGCYVDGSSAKDSGFSICANENFDIPYELHNGALAAGKGGKLLISSDQCFPPNTVSEIYVVYGVQYWISADRVSGLCRLDSVGDLQQQACMRRESFSGHVRKALKVDVEERPYVISATFIKRFESFFSKGAIFKKRMKTYNRGVAKAVKKRGKILSKARKCRG